MDGKQPKIKIYIDATRAPQLAHALNIIQSHLNLQEKKAIEVLSIVDEFGVGTADEAWIPKVGAESGIVITDDRRIQRVRHQRQLYIEHGVGIIFLKAPKGGLTFGRCLFTWWNGGRI